MKTQGKTSLPLILGSASRWRKSLLTEAGFEFSIMKPDIDEKSIRHHDPKQLALLIAHAKADELLPKIKQPSLLITTDQIVYCHGQIFEKPSSKAEIYYFYDCYAKYGCETVTAIVVVNTATNKRVAGVDIAKVYHKPIPKAVAEQYIEKGDIFHCAGGFQIEDENGKLDPYIERVEGSIDSVKGLPLELLNKLIRKVRC